jgi:hypothetical protein
MRFSGDRIARRTRYKAHRLELYENAGEILSSPFRLHARFHFFFAPVGLRLVAAGKQHPPEAVHCLQTSQV